MNGQLGREFATTRSAAVPIGERQDWTAVWAGGNASLVTGRLTCQEAHATIAPRMPESAYAVGQAVFIRTDTPDYAEETIPFKTLDEMVNICCRTYPHLTLEKIIVYSLVNNEPCALTLGFVSSTKAQRPGHLQIVD